MEEQEPLVPFRLLLELKQIQEETRYFILQDKNQKTLFYIFEHNATEPFISLEYNKEEENDNTQRTNTQTGTLGGYSYLFSQRILGIIEERENRSRAESRESGARIATSEERENRSRAVGGESESLVQGSGFLQGISNSNLWRRDYQQNHRGIQEQQLKNLQTQEKELLRDKAVKLYTQNNSDEYSLILKERIFYHQKQSFIKKAKDYNKRKHILYPDAKEKIRIELAKEYLELTQNPLFSKKPFRSEEIDIIKSILESPSINKEI